jgi:hypothetical protein
MVAYLGAVLSHPGDDGQWRPACPSLRTASGLASIRPEARAELPGVRGGTGEAQVLKPGPCVRAPRVNGSPGWNRRAGGAGSAAGVLPVQLGFEQVHGLEEGFLLAGGELVQHAGQRFGGASSQWPIRVA